MELQRNQMIFHPFKRRRILNGKLHRSKKLNKIVDAVCSKNPTVFSGKPEKFLEELEKIVLLNGVVKERTHTIFFHYEGNNLYMSYAVVHKDLDNFSRKYGREKAMSRMSNLLSRSTDNPERTPNPIDYKYLCELLPARVIRTLPKYVAKAVKNLKVKLTDNLVFRGDGHKNGKGSTNSVYKITIDEVV